MINDKKTKMKAKIFQAAYDCFLQYGYSKTTFVDIVKRAEISRASIYLYFKNKEDLFIAMNKNLHDIYVTRSEEILNSNFPNKEKLSKIIDVWIVNHYRDMKNTNYANELLDGLLRVSKQTEKRFKELFIKSIAPIVDEDMAEIIVLSMRGLMNDRPPVKTLQRRIEVLIDGVMHSD
jgi:TetR/AcrR family transcriptional regulator, transcriptional repressor of aconitase